MIVYDFAEVILVHLHSSLKDVVADFAEELAVYHA